MTRQHDTVVVSNCTICAETDKAIKIALKDGGSHWIPLSHVDQIHREGMNKDWLVISKWIAEKKGLTEPEKAADDGIIY